jgi:hypothetical protein
MSLDGWFRFQSITTTRFAIRHAPLRFSSQLL